MENLDWVWFVLKNEYLCGMKLRNETEVTHEVIDPETGEVKQYKTTTSKTFTARVNTEQFYMTFISAMDAMERIGSPTDLKVLNRLCAMAEYDKNTVYLTAARRRELSAALEIQVQTLNNSLQKLKKAGAISMNGGNVFVNPKYLWKGQLSSRDKLLRDSELSVTFCMNQLEENFDNQSTEQAND